MQEENLHVGNDDGDDEDEDEDEDEKESDSFHPYRSISFDSFCCCVNLVVFLFFLTLSVSSVSFFLCSDMLVYRHRSGHLIPVTND